MKKTLVISMAVAAVLLAFGASRLLAADSNKEVTITGQAVCAKCVLHESSTCQSVVQVEQDGKKVNYYLAPNDLSTTFHKSICETAGEKVTVTGTVTMSDGKETLTPTKIEPVK